MKIRSFLLASLAAMAMVSCSNENEPAIDGGNAEKDAVLNFSIALPSSSPASRAVTQGKDEQGTEAESNVKDITLILTYAGEAAPAFKQTYAVGDFAHQDGTNVYTLTNAILVAPGNATVRVYVNGNPEGTTIAAESAFSLGEFASVTNSNFFMSGENTVEIVANETRTASVKVDRVAAKLAETTADPKFIIEAKNSKVNEELTITLTDYTFSNLNMHSNIMKSANTYYNADHFYNKFLVSGSVADWSVFGANIISMTAEDKATYCFENNKADGAPTKIFYKAHVAVEGVADGANFYVYKNKLYKDFAAINKEFNGFLTSQGLSDASGYADFLKQGVQKYTAGICYYSADIKTADGANILRNNYYKLAVTKIGDLGLPEIDGGDPEEPTLLGLEVTVKNWTVWNNDIEL